MSRIARILIIVSLLILPLFLMQCSARQLINPSGGLTQDCFPVERGKGTVAVDPSTQLSTVGDAPLTEGTLSMVIGSKKDMTLDIIAGATEGVLFKPAEAVYIEQGGRVAIIEDVAMRAEESRTLRIPFEVDPSTYMAGEYPIVVAAYENGGLGNERKLLGTGQTNSFIHLVGGYPQFLPSWEAFSQLMPDAKQLKETEFQMTIRLAESDRPKTGALTLRVPSKENGYAPEISASVSENGGITFDETEYTRVDGNGQVAYVSLMELAECASRIVVLPFHLNPNSYDGTYSVEVLSTVGKKTKTDRLPIGIQVSSTTLGGGDRWLALIELE